MQPRGRPNLLAQSLDTERKSRRGFGKGIGGPAPQPQRPGVDPSPEFQGGPNDAEDYTAGVGGAAPQPERPGMDPQHQFPPRRRAGNRMTGRNRGRPSPQRGQGPDQDSELGMESRDPED